MTPERPPITVRDATADDMRFVKASWYESYRRNNLGWKDLSPDVYHAGHARVIDDLCRRPGVKIAVAVATEIPDEICSWIAYEGDTLHYLYTKQAYRHLRIALNLAQLVMATGKFTFKFCSHLTRGGLKLSQFLRVRFNPYLQFHETKKETHQ